MEKMTINWELALKDGKFVLAPLHECENTPIIRGGGNDGECSFRGAFKEEVASGAARSLQLANHVVYEVRHPLEEGTVILFSSEIKK